MAGPAVALGAAVASASALPGEEAQRQVAAALWAVAIARTAIMSEVSVMPPQAALVVMAVLTAMLMLVVDISWLDL